MASSKLMCDTAFTARATSQELELSLFFRRTLERKLSSWMTTTLIIICTETNYILYLRHSILFLDCMQTQKLSSVYCRQLVFSKTKRTRDTKQNQEVLTKKTKKQKTRQPFSDTLRTTYVKRNFLAPFFSHGSFYRARIVTFVPRCTRRVQCIKLEKMSQLLHRLVIISGFCWGVGGGGGGKWLTGNLTKISFKSYHHGHFLCTFRVYKFMHSAGEESGQFYNQFIRKKAQCNRRYRGTSKE